LAKTFQNSQQGCQVIRRGTWRHLIMMMSMMRITKIKVDRMMPYWRRLGCFIKGALRTKEFSKG
jgi:hypothetical protein